jgi:hypothetical protein
MVTSDVLAFASQAAVAVLFISGNPPIALLAALSAVNRAANALFIPAVRGLVPQIVEQSELQSANALIRLSQNSTSLAGAAVSGAALSVRRCSPKSAKAGRSSGPGSGSG